MDLVAAVAERNDFKIGKGQKPPRFIQRKRNQKDFLSIVTCVYQVGRVLVGTWKEAFRFAAPVHEVAPKATTPAPDCQTDG